MLENGVSLMPGANGRFHQASGLCFTYDIQQAAGSRVTGAVRQAADGSCTGAPIDLTAASTYSMAENDFMADGGDGYPVFRPRMTTREIMDECSRTTSPPTRRSPRRCRTGSCVPTATPRRRRPARRSCRRRQERTRAAADGRAPRSSERLRAGGFGHVGRDGFDLRRRSVALRRPACRRRRSDRCASTVSSSGMRSSRFGPVVPSEPAAASVWQVPQLLAKTAAPSAPPSVVSAVVAAVVAAPSESSSSPPQPAAATTSSASTTAMIHTRSHASFYGGSQAPVSLPRRRAAMFSPGSGHTSRFPVAYSGNAVGVHTREGDGNGHHRIHHPGPLAGLIAKALLPGDDPGGIIITPHRRRRRNPGRIPRRRAFRRGSDG